MKECQGAQLLELGGVTRGMVSGDRGVDRDRPRLDFVLAKREIAEGWLNRRFLKRLIQKNITKLCQVMLTIPNL